MIQSFMSHDSRSVGSFNDMTMMNERGLGPIGMLPSSGGASTLRQAKPRPSLSNSQNDKAVREHNFNNLTLLSVLGYLLLFLFLLVFFFFGLSLSWALCIARKGAVSNPTRPYLAPCRGIAMVMRTSQEGLFWAYGTWAGSDHHRPSARPGRLPFPTDKTKRKKREKK
jgi:hypothetical protein